MAVNSLSISQAREGEELYVLNTSGRKGVPPGNVNFSTRSGSGQLLVVCVPVTDIPVELTTMATKQSILESPEFRNLLAARMLTIISEDDAQNRLASPAAQEELRRVRRYNMDTEVVLSNTSVPAAAENAAAESKVSGMALNLGNTNDDEAVVLQQLRLNKSSFSVEDFRYIAQMSTLARVKQEAAQMAIEAAQA